MFYTERIRPLFESSNKSDASLEKEIGLPRGIIYDWNIGRSKSYKKYIGEIANYFNVSADYLLGKEQKETNTTESEQTELTGVYLSLAKEAQQNGIHPDDIKLAIETIKKLRQK